MNVFIYYLADPREPEHIRYIGITSKDSVEGRLAEHVREINCKKTQTHKIKWVRKIVTAGLRPLIGEITCLNEVTEEEAFETEISYIQYFKDKGHKLVNTTIGGKGTFGHKLSEETKELLAEKGRKQWLKTSDEFKRKHTEMFRNIMIGNQFAKGRKDTPKRIEEKKAFWAGKKHLNWVDYIVQMDDDFNVIREWECSKDAAASVGRGYKSIWTATWKMTKDGKPYKCGGYYWKYKNDENYGKNSGD